jgi:NADH-quinone oxidoreductase subunit E
MSVFSDQLQSKIEGYLDRYETRRSSILPILHAIQDEHGYVKEEHVDELEGRYDLKRVYVKEVITFYDIFKDDPVRKFQVRFCENITCTMLGAFKVMEHIKGHIKKLEAELGDDTPFSLEGFPCLGKCDGAPVMLVNKNRHEKVTLENVDAMLEQYAPLPKG